MAYDSRLDTYKHIARVRHYMLKVIQGLESRMEAHDLSKLESPEREVFDEMTPKLAASTYGSEEYNSFLKEMQVGLQHHYRENSHHPEHYAFEFGVVSPELVANGTGIRGMSLLDIVEMLCDWKAATERHNDGCIRRSIEHNQRRFGYSEDLRSILSNTLPDIEC